PPRRRDRVRPPGHRADDFGRRARAGLGQDTGVSAQRAVVLQHTPTEGPERVAVVLAERGVACAVRSLYRGETVPDDLAPDEILVVMGGPMGVGDVGDPRWPFLAAEIALLRQLVARDAPVLGICLGAQLLAAASGA